PEIAVFTMLDEPTSGRYYGSLISAPVSSKVMADIMPYLGYEPQYSEEELKKLAKSVPNVMGKTVSTAKDMITAEGLTYKVIGSGEKVEKQLPENGSMILDGGVVLLYTDKEAEEQKTTVPSFIGYTLSQVNTLASQYGLNVHFKGNIVSDKAVVSYLQSIPEGTEVSKGSVIEVHFRSNETGDIGA
ncbi:MAG: PASTA domain-containing protein, partial [Clostridia bacterium]|nr:PASTA domain-containing protein [Clostridia bacterium]